MYDDDIPAFSTAALRQAFAHDLGASALSGAETRFVDQVADDVRAEELPDVGPGDLAVALAKFWRFAEQRDAGGPKLRLSHALGADARDLKLELLEIVQDDAPFLVDSVMGELAAAGIEVRAMFHPVVKIARDASGQRRETGEAREELMILVVLSSVGEDRREALLDALRLTLADVHAAVRDGAAMHALMRQVAAELTTSHAPFGAYGAEEYAQFLQWLSADRFIFLGARSYDYPRTPDGAYATEEPHYTPEGCLGVLRDVKLSVLRRASEPAILTSDLAAYLERAEPLIVAKSTLKSRVHRRGHMDYIGVKRYDAQGCAIGEVRFIGLFTAEAYEDPARHLPLVRRKVEHVLARAGENPSAHTGKRLRTIAESYPRDELFQIDEETLYQISMGVLHLFDRPRVRVFWRVDAFDRFVSALLYVPLDRFDSELQDHAGKLLAQAWGGRVSAVYPYFSDQPLARVHYIIGVSPGDHPQADLEKVEAEIAEAARTWLDRFETAARNGGVAPGMVGEILSRYAHGFPAGYRDQYDAAEALEDISVIEGLAEDEPLRVRAYRRPEELQHPLPLQALSPRQLGAAGRRAAGAGGHGAEGAGGRRLPHHPQLRRRPQGGHLGA